MLLYKLSMLFSIFLPLFYVFYSNIFTFGTLKRNKVHIPVYCCAKKRQVQLDLRSRMLNANILHTKKKRKVILISSIHFTGEVDKTTKKSKIIHFCNLTKGGVDVLDKLC